VQQVGILETLSRIWKKIKGFLDNDEISLNCRVQSKLYDSVIVGYKKSSLRLQATRMPDLYTVIEQWSNENNRRHIG